MQQDYLDYATNFENAFKTYLTTRLNVDVKTYSELTDSEETKTPIVIIGFSKGPALDHQSLNGNYRNYDKHHGILNIMILTTRAGMRTNRDLQAKIRLALRTENVQELDVNYILENGFKESNVDEVVIDEDNMDQCTTSYDFIFGHASNVN